MSIAVLEEEDSLYVLCRVGFGDFSKPYDSNSAFGAKTSCSSRESPDEPVSKPDCTYPVNPPTSSSSGSMKNKTQKAYAYNECVNPIKFYAIYSFSVKEKIPLVLIEERRSERLFTCAPIFANADWDGCKSQYVQPELVRVPSSVTLLVKNCKDILYYSPNGGRTMFNTQVQLIFNLIQT